MSIKTLVILTIATAMGCASANGGLFSLGPRPAALAGVWIDSARTSATDSSLWLLEPQGDERSVRVSAGRGGVSGSRVERSPERSWYLSGDLTDTTHRSLCLKRRPRDGATCMQFSLDTLRSGGGSRRRLIVFGSEDRKAPGTVFLERLP